jgi:hypothetical protein
LILITTRTITYRLLMCAKLGPEITLVTEIERVRNTVVGLLECAHAEATDVLHALHLGRRTRTEGCIADASIAHLANDVGKDVLI